MTHTIDQHDIVIAPYSLLQRDRERWLQTPWHLVVLDEAQNIKNASTHAAQVAGQLQTRGTACACRARRWKTTWAKSGACSTS